MSQPMNDKLAKYPSTPMFRIKDTIGVPHYYCITPRHVEYAADHCGGVLGREAILAAEKHGAKCGICKGRLTYAEHETALLVAVKGTRELKDVPGLHEYLLECKPLCEADGFAGFAFVQE